MFSKRACVYWKNLKINFAMKNRSCRKGFAANPPPAKKKKEKKGGGGDTPAREVISVYSTEQYCKSPFVFFQVLIIGLPRCDHSE